MNSYQHGGVSLQEMLIPLVKFNKINMIEINYSIDKLI